MTIIELYNPMNAQNLTQDEIDKMKELTDEELEALAKAYPNRAYANAYLVILDTKFNRSTLSTWQNIFSLRKHWKENKVRFVPLTFSKIWKGNNTAERKAGVTFPRANAQDLTEAELKSAEGIVPIEPQQEVVTKEKASKKK